MDIDKAMKACLEQEKSLEMVKSHLGMLDVRLLERQKDLELMERVMAKEYIDIIKLEELGMRKLFHKVLGSSFEDQLEKEREEYLLAVLKHKEIVKSIDLMQFEQRILKEKLAKHPLIKAELKRLTDIREQEVLKKGGKHQNDLRNSNRKLDQLVQQSREIYEAKIAAAKSKQKVSGVIRYLQQAKVNEEWNHEHYQRSMHLDSVQKAQEMFYEMENVVHYLEDELADIYQHRNLRFLEGTIDLDKISLNYHQKLITDWAVLQRIEQSQEEMEFLLIRLERLMLSLEEEDREVRKKIERLEKEKKNLLLDD